MKEEELRQYCKDASLEISNMQHTIDNLQSQLKAKEEVIKEAREYVSKEFLCYDNESDEYICGVKLLEILSKGENK